MVPAEEQFNDVPAVATTSVAGPSEPFSSEKEPFQSYYDQTYDEDRNPVWDKDDHPTTAKEQEELRRLRYPHLYHTFKDKEGNPQPEGVCGVPPTPLGIPFLGVQPKETAKRTPFVAVSAVAPVRTVCGSERFPPSLRSNDEAVLMFKGCTEIVLDTLFGT